VLAVTREQWRSGFQVSAAMLAVGSLTVNAGGKNGVNNADRVRLAFSVALQCKEKLYKAVIR